MASVIASIAPSTARADDALAPLMAAARTADRGELERAAARVATRDLADCVASAARARRIACTEAAAFVTAPTSGLLGRLVEALSARDRAVAVAAGEALEALTQPERLSGSELGRAELAPTLTALASAALDRQLGPDVRAAALHVLARFPRQALDAAALLEDPDPVVRREAIAALAAGTGSADTKRALSAAATNDRDEPVAAAAAAALCEAAQIPHDVDVRVRRWLAGRTLGPASLAPLLACARSRTDGASRAWLAAAASSPRQDVRALVAPSH